MVHDGSTVAVTVVYNLVGGLEHEFYDFPYIGNSSAQLTFMFFRGVGIPSTSDIVIISEPYWYHVITISWFFWTVIVAIQPSDIVIDRHILAHYSIDSTGHNIEISPTHEEILQPGFEWLIDTVWVWVEKVTNCTKLFLEHCGCVDGQSLDDVPWWLLQIITYKVIRRNIATRTIGIPPSRGGATKNRGWRPAQRSWDSAVAKRWV